MAQSIMHVTLAQVMMSYSPLGGESTSLSAPTHVRARSLSVSLTQINIC